MSELNGANAQSGDNGDLPVEWVDLGKMFVDVYGRPLKPARKRWLDKKTFDFDLAQVAEVSRRDDGRYALLDGQGRKYLAQKDGVKSILAKVHTGLTYEQEADLFVKYNSDRFQTTPVEEFNAAVEAKHELELAIMAVLEERDLTVNYGHGKTSVRAVEVMRDIARQKDMGLGVLGHTLDVIHDAWHDSGDDTALYAADIMSGMAQFWVRYNSLIPSYKELLSSLRRTRPQRLRMDAALITAGPTHPHKYTATGMAILDAFNWKRSTNRLPEWDLTFSKAPQFKAKKASNGATP